jgi:hypothetical protein
VLFAVPLEEMYMESSCRVKPLLIMPEDIRYAIKTVPLMKNVVKNIFGA